MITRMAWQQTTDRLSRLLFTIILAGTLGLAVHSRPAQAGSRWVGPAIAGAVIGGVLAHEYYRHQPRYYRPYYGKPAKYYRRHYRPRPYYGPYAYYGPPAVVIPLPVPVPFFVAPGY